MESKFCKTRTAEIGMDTRGFLSVKILPGSVIDEDDALDNFLVIKNISENQKQLKLIDLRGNWSMTIKAKEVSKKNSSAENTLARAFITDSFLTKLTAEFLESFSEPEVHQKFFTSENEAIEWLLTKKV